MSYPNSPLHTSHYRPNTTLAAQTPQRIAATCAHLDAEFGRVMAFNHYTAMFSANDRTLDTDTARNSPTNSTVPFRGVGYGPASNDHTAYVFRARIWYQYSGAEGDSSLTHTFRVSRAAGTFSETETLVTTEQSSDELIVTDILLSPTADLMGVALRFQYFLSHTTATGAAAGAYTPVAFMVTSEPA